MKRLEALHSTSELAGLVHERIQFVARQATHRSAPARYRLRDSGITVYLRHTTPDVNSFDQIFRLGHYEPPAAMEQVLESAEAPLRVVDLGANVGFFSAFVFGRYPVASVIAVEPAPENLEVLELAVAANPGLDWRIVAACAGVQDGRVAFESGLFTNSRVAEANAATISVPCIDVFPFLGDADLLKLDIEGSEWAILEDERFRRVSARAIALEYHSELCPAPDPRKYALALLQEAHYETMEVEFAASPGHGMIWAWKIAESKS